MDLEIDFFINEKEKDSSDDKWEMEGTGHEIRNAFDIFEEDEGDDEYYLCKIFCLCREINTFKNRKKLSVKYIFSINAKINSAKFTRY